MVRPHRAGPFRTKFSVGSPSHNRFNSPRGIARAGDLYYPSQVADSLNTMSPVVRPTVPIAIRTQLRGAVYWTSLLSPERPEPAEAELLDGAISVVDHHVAKDFPNHARELEAMPGAD